MSDEQPNPRATGPVEDGSWPPTLEAHVVDPGPPLRIHGYAAHDDLARHHRANEIAWLAYTGELPTDVQHRLYDLALAILAPAAITGAAGHVAVLARLLAAPNANVVGLAAMMCAERASADVSAHASWLAWCAKPTESPPEGFAASGDDAAPEVARAQVNALGIDVPGVTGVRATPLATALALLHASGLRDPLRLVSAIVQAQLPCLVAEAERHTPRRLQHYPIEVPPFDYTEDEGG